MPDTYLESELVLYVDVAGDYSSWDVWHIYRNCLFGNEFVLYANVASDYSSYV
jgi:hypothetical protein